MTKNKKITKKRVKGMRPKGIKSMEQDDLSDFMQAGADDVHKQLKPLSKKEYEYYMNL